jgi:hypothetical protein
MAESQVPEQVKDYPENRMFGHTLPAAAFMYGMQEMWIFIM